MIKPGQKYIVVQTLKFSGGWIIPKKTILYAPKCIPRWTQYFLSTCVPIVWKGRVRIISGDCVESVIGKGKPKRKKVISKPHLNRCYWCKKKTSLHSINSRGSLVCP